jgi:hypothetical protein
MTEEQFKQLMDKLDEIQRAQPGHQNPYLPQQPGPNDLREALRRQWPQHYPAPQPWQPYDGYPRHWGDYGVRD